MSIPPAQGPENKNSLEAQNKELLIRLDEGQKYLIERIALMEEQMNRAEEKRDKIDDKLANQQHDIYVIGYVVAQQRDIIKGISQQVTEALERAESKFDKIDPIVDEWRSLKKLGRFTSIVMVAIGVTGLSMFLAAKQMFVDILSWIIRHT